MRPRVRIAVVGAGLIGQAHISRILEEPEAELTGIADPSTRSREQAQRLGVLWAPDIEGLLADVSLDGVVIATPNHLHVRHGMAAVRAGVAMLLEKPVSNDLDTALVLVAAAEEAHVPILVGHQRRHSPLIKRSRDLIASGKLGRITAVTGLCLFRKPSEDYFEGKNAWRREPGGGVVLINLIHVVDDLRNLCGDVIAVQASQSHAARGFAVEDTAAIILNFANGALGTISISDATAAPWSWELTSGENRAYPQTDQFCYLIAGTSASIALPRFEIWSHEGDGWWTPIQSKRTTVPAEDPLRLQMRHFVDVVRRNAVPIVDGREGARTLEITLAAKRAAETGKVIRVS